MTPALDLLLTRVLYSIQMGLHFDPMTIVVHMQIAVKSPAIVAESLGRQFDKRLRLQAVSVRQLCLELLLVQSARRHMRLLAWHQNGLLEIGLDLLRHAVVLAADALRVLFRRCLYCCPCIQVGHYSWILANKVAAQKLVVVHDRCL